MSVEADTEDLDLLGKGAKVSTTTPISNTIDVPAYSDPPDIQQALPPNQGQDMFNVQPMAVPAAHPAAGLNGTMGYDQPAPADFRTGFDFDAFLANFGVNNDFGADIMGSGGAFI